MLDVEGGELKDATHCTPPKTQNILFFKYKIQEIGDKDV